MAKVIFTPWKDQSQLLAVRNQFYPPRSYDGPDQRSSACATIGAWKLRGNLPHPVEATALLTDAILHDDARENSVFSIRATYSAAFCRFVTGLVDSKLHGQRKTMFQRAIDLGLPASFVELRHEATHRELPSLIVLRNAAQRSLEWLWDYYWSGVDQHALDVRGDVPQRDDDDVEPLKGMIRDVIGPFTSEWIRTEQQKSNKKRLQQLQSELAVQLSSICRTSIQGARALSQILVHEHLLVPEERRVGDPLDQKFRKWNQLLQMVTENHPQFLTSLTDELVNVLAFSSESTSIASTFHDGIAMWLDHILTEPEWQPSRRFLSSSYILTVCRDNPNTWTNSLETSIHVHEAEQMSAAEVVGSAILSRSTRSGSRSITQSDNGQGDVEALARFGWTIPERWNISTLGIV